MITCSLIVKKIIFNLFTFREDDESRRSLEQQAERARQYELEQVLRLEKQKKKREQYQR